MKKKASYIRSVSGLHAEWRRERRRPKGLCRAELKIEEIVQRECLRSEWVKESKDKLEKKERTAPSVIIISQNIAVSKVFDYTVVAKPWNNCMDCLDYEKKINIFLHFLTCWRGKNKRLIIIKLFLLFKKITLVSKGLTKRCVHLFVSKICVCVCISRFKPMWLSPTVTPYTNFNFSFNFYLVTFVCCQPDASPCYNHGESGYERQDNPWKCLVWPGF